MLARCCTCRAAALSRMQFLPSSVTLVERAAPFVLQDGVPGDTATFRIDFPARGHDRGDRDVLSHRHELLDGCLHQSKRTTLLGLVYRLEPARGTFGIRAGRHESTAPAFKAHLEETFCPVLLNASHLPEEEVVVVNDFLVLSNVGFQPFTGEELAHRHGGVAGLLDLPALARIGNIAGAADAGKPVVARGRLSADAAYYLLEGADLLRGVIETILHVGGRPLAQIFQVHPATEEGVSVELLLAA